MRRHLLLLALSACASIPTPTTAPAPDLTGDHEVDACVVWSERLERPMVFAARASGGPWHQAAATVVLRHPWGTSVIDPPFGRTIAADLRGVPPYMKAITGTPKTKTPAAFALERGGVDVRRLRDVLITHAHWDHTGGLGDLPVPRVRLARVEADWALDKQRYLDDGVMPHHLEAARDRLRPFDFEGPAVLRFAASHDLYGDGAIIAVPLPGHTPGSTGYLVRGTGGKRWLFVGDAAWAVRGVEAPAHKLLTVIDHDVRETGVTLGALHALSVEHPEIAIIPAHDGDALAQLPECGVR